MQCKIQRNGCSKPTLFTLVAVDLDGNVSCQKNGQINKRRFHWTHKDSRLIQRMDTFNDASLTDVDDCLSRSSLLIFM